MTTSDSNLMHDPNDSLSKGDGLLSSCPKCAGRGWHWDWDWVTPVILSILAAVLMWFGWRFIQKSLRETTVGNIQFAIAFSLGGPALLIYAWWKASRPDCEACEGTGLVKRDMPHEDDSVSNVPDVSLEEQYCNRCQQNVRTISLDPRCPECDSPIAPDTLPKPRRPSRAEFRADVVVAILFIAGIPLAYWLFGLMGLIVFFAVMFALYILAKIVRVWNRR